MRTANTPFQLYLKLKWRIVMYKFIYKKDRVLAYLIQSIILASVNTWLIWLVVKFYEDTFSLVQAIYT